MPEASVSDMVVTDFRDQLVFQGNPFGTACGGPAAGAAWCIAGEAGRVELFQGGMKASGAVVSARD